MTGVEVVPFGQHTPNFQTVVPYDHIETWDNFTPLIENA